jgi:hypothetical protein
MIGTSWLIASSLPFSYGWPHAASFALGANRRVHLARAAFSAVPAVGVRLPRLSALPISGSHRPAQYDRFHCGSAPLQRFRAGFSCWPSSAGRCHTCLFFVHCRQLLSPPLFTASLHRLFPRAWGFGVMGERVGRRGNRRWRGAGMGHLPDLSGLGVWQRRLVCALVFGHMRLVDAGDVRGTAGRGCRGGRCLDGGVEGGRGLGAVWNGARGAVRRKTMAFSRVPHVRGVQALYDSVVFSYSIWACRFGI